MHYVKQKSLTQRILQIVKRLYSAEKLQSKELALEYDVSPRTIHRDMKKIEEVIALTNDLGVWQLNTKQRHDGNNYFHQTLLGSFAHNLEIDTDCLEKFNINEKNVAYAIDYKYLPKKLGEQIIYCIQSEVRCSFTYAKESSLTHRKIDPVKIYTENGRWYVIARDYKDDRVKYFNLAKIKNFKILLGQSSTLTESMIEEANKMKSIWSSSGENEILVKLFVKPEIASYIKDIKLHKSQIIFDEHYNGGLEVHCTITNKLELLPQVKYWLPRVHILEPLWLRDELMQDLNLYKIEDNRLR